MLSRIADSLFWMTRYVERTDGIFTIISTNDISKVDPALGQPRQMPDGVMEFIYRRFFETK